MEKKIGGQPGRVSVGEKEATAGASIVHMRERPSEL